MQDPEYQDQIKDYFGSKVDVVLSDMAVNTTGNKNLDSIYTSELCIGAMNFSKKILKIKKERKIYAPWHIRSNTSWT